MNRSYSVLKAFNLQRLLRRAFHQQRPLRSILKNTFVNSYLKEIQQKNVECCMGSPYSYVRHCSSHTGDNTQNVSCDNMNIDISDSSKDDSFSDVPDDGVSGKNIDDDYVSGDNDKDDDFEARYRPSAEFMETLSLSDKEQVDMILKNFLKANIEREKLEHLQTEENRKRNKFLVPKKLTDKHWSRLLTCKSKTAIWKVLHLFFKKEITKIKQIEKKALKTEIKPSYNEEKEKKTFLFFDKHKFYHRNLILAQEYGHDLVIDLQFEADSDRGRREILKQILELHGYNRRQAHPFNLVYCNWNPDDPIYGQLNEKLGTKMPVNITQKSYLDIFPPERLVYLSPDSKVLLPCFSREDIYIIGGLIDHSDHVKPHTLELATKLKIRNACLPLEFFNEYIKTILTLDQVVKILYDMKETNHWPTALRHVPERFLREVNEERSEKRRAFKERREKQKEEEDLTSNSQQ